MLLNYILIMEVRKLVDEIKKNRESNKVYWNPLPELGILNYKGDISRQGLRK